MNKCKKLLSVWLALLIGFGLILGSPAPSNAAASGTLDEMLGVLDSVAAGIDEWELWKLNESRDIILNAPDPAVVLADLPVSGPMQPVLNQNWDSDQLQFAIRLLIRPSVTVLKQDLAEIRDQYTAKMEQLVGANPAEVLALLIDVDQELSDQSFNDSSDFKEALIEAFYIYLLSNQYDSLLESVLNYLDAQQLDLFVVKANPSLVPGFDLIKKILTDSYLPPELGPEPQLNIPDEPVVPGTPPPPPAQLPSGGQLLQTTESTAVVGAGGAIKLNFPAAAVTVPEGQQALVVVAQLDDQAAEQTIKSANPPPDWRGLGPVIHLQLRVGAPGSEQTVTSLEQPVAMELSFAGLDLQGLEPGSLDIFRIPDAGGPLEAQGGRVDRKQQVIRAQVKGFSSFTLGYRERSFADLEGHWGRTDVLALAARGIVNGVADGRFAPDVTITRAELAALLVRTLNVPVKQSAASRFKDVAASAWYAAEVETAAEAGLVAGYPDGSYAPNATVTRLELAVMLGRALRNTQKDWGTTAVETALAQFTDAALVPAWARADAALTASRAIIRGLPGGLLAPAGQCTRAEAAVMLWRLLQP